MENDPSHKEIYDMCRPLSDISEGEKKQYPMYEETPWLKDDPEGKFTWIYDTLRKYQQMMH